MKRYFKIPITFMLITATNLGVAESNSTTSITVDIQFVNTITLGSVTNLDFGDITTSIANTETIIVDTAGSVTGTGAAGSYIGNASAGSIPITANSAAIDCYISNISSTNSAKFTLASPTCNYNSIGETTCTAGSKHTFTPPDISTKNMAFGLTLTKGSTAVSNENLSETLDIICDYQ